MPEKKKRTLKDFMNAGSKAKVKRRKKREAKEARKSTQSAQ